ncbi:MAG: Por secretion system C-terminal sorting protein, partial [Verrucomicrobiales bacterium]|nr:Por secretion system C-terminal sorting protein [Verrucomicrobiales bacterium]
MKTVRMLKVLLASQALLCTGTAPAQVVISEFMAANSHGIVDEDGTHSDWLELYNAGTTPVMLDGWYLTDDSGWSTKWRFPEGMAPLQPNSYLLVWASGKDKRIATNPLHTNFKLGRESGYLALLDTTATVVSSFDSYPPQIVDVSYGRDRINLDLVGFFHNPTPNAQNINGAVPPVFSHESGIYTNASISVTITAAGTVYYTSDSSLPNTNSTLYTGPITLATNSTIKARAFPPAGSTDLPSDVVARNYIFLDDSTVDFNSNLPLLIISTEGRPLNEIDTGAPRTNGSLTVIDVKNARSALRSVPDAQVLAGFEYYGQTSIGFPKKPIRVETQDAYGNDLKMSILGLPPAADFKLRNPYDDKTFLNDFLSTELYEQMGHYSVKRRYVEVFLNTGGGRLHYDTDYYGIMVLFESIEIDQERLNLAKISVTATNEPEISGGYIFKKDKDSPGDVNFYTAGGSGFFQQYIRIHEPRAKDLRASLPNGPLTDVGRKQLGYLNNYLNMMERALYANDWLTATGTNHYSYYLDADSFVDLHWMVEFAKYVDGYRVSSFFYKDRGGKVTAGPIWGWNFAFGNCNFLLGGQTNGWYSDELDDSTRIWLHRLIYGSPSGTNGIGDPNFVQKIADRWGVLRTNIFNSSHVMARIDELASYLKGAAQRDFAKYNTLGKYIWPNPDGGVATAGSNGTIDGRDVDYVRPTTYNDGTSNSIIWQMKKYVNGRYLWIDSQFTAPPFIHVSSGAVTNGYSVVITAKPGAQLYYRTDGLDPRGAGGTTNGTLYT